MRAITTMPLSYRYYVRPRPVLSATVWNRFEWWHMGHCCLQKPLTIDALNLKTALKTAAAHEVVDREDARLMPISHVNAASHTSYNTELLLCT